MNFLLKFFGKTLVAIGNFFTKIGGKLLDHEIRKSSGWYIRDEVVKILASMFDDDKDYSILPKTTREKYNAATLKGPFVRKE